jgi:hypothetical protein
MRQPVLIGLSLGLALALPAAAEPPAADAPVATASGSPPAAEQIETYLRTSPAAAREESGPLMRRERRVHGEVSVGVGTRGYREVSGRVDIPLGEDGHVSIAARHSEADVWAYDPDGGLDGLGPYDCASEPVGAPVLRSPGCRAASGSPVERPVAPRPSGR